MKLNRREQRKAERRDRAARRFLFQQRRNKPAQVEVVQKPVNDGAVPKRAKRRPSKMGIKRDDRTAAEQLDQFYKQARKERQKRQVGSIDQDEKEIQHLEKRLGLAKQRKRGRTKLPKVYAEEGLDFSTLSDLLNVCDNLGDPSALVESDMDSDESVETSNVKDNSDRGVHNLEKKIVKDDSLESMDDASVSGESGSEQGSIDLDEGNKRIMRSAAPGEDIYGRPLSNKSEKEHTETELHIKSVEGTAAFVDGNLVKLLRRLINRLSEQTMVSSVSQLEKIYAGNSHNEVKQHLSSCLLSSLCVPFRLPARLVCELGMLVALVHNNVQIELSSFVIEEMAYKFNDLLENRREVDDQAASNVATMFCRLFQFQVIQAKLILDILEHLLDRFTGDDLQLILTILGECGIALRKADAIRVKSFIEAAQIKASTSTASSGVLQMEGSKVKFLQETLVAVKNNNAMRLPVSAVDSNLLEHFHKLLRGLLKGGIHLIRSGKGGREPAAVFGLSDLLQARTRGRWWIVGAAWRADHLEQQGQTKAVAAPSDMRRGNAALAERLLQFDATTVELARKARMNTDLRRLIFCVLVTVEGPVAAFEKLQSQNIKGKQEREIINVTVACCLREADYNQYYVQVIERFCSHDKTFQTTTQYVLFDRIRAVASLPDVQRRNLARLLSDVILKKILPLNVLRCVDFAALDKATSRLLRRILLAVITSCDQKVLGQLFAFVSHKKTGANGIFIDGLRIFLDHVMRRVCASDARVLAKLDFVESLWTVD